MVLNDEHMRTVVVNVPQLPFWGLNLEIANSADHCREVFVFSQTTN
jgi:hypothetical protein